MFEGLESLVSFAGDSSEEVWYDRERQNFTEPEDIFVELLLLNAREADSLILTTRSLIIL
jgi:hypothetical protein